MSKQITAAEFEQECQGRIMGNLWENSFNEDYQEGVVLTVSEMRQIANLLRAKEGLDEGVVCEVGTYTAADEAEEGE